VTADRWLVASGCWSVVAGYWLRLVVGGRWSVVGGRVVAGQRSLATGCGRWPVVGGRSGGCWPPDRLLFAPVGWLLVLFAGWVLCVCLFVEVGGAGPLARLSSCPTAPRQDDRAVLTRHGRT
jgi:hypothetical protein